VKYIKDYKNYKLLNESKNSELQGLNILKSKEISNPESIIKKLSVGDKSNNQKNIPFMCFLLDNNVEIDDLIRVFNEYDDLERKKRVKSIQLIKNQLVVGDEKFTDFLDFSEWVHGESSKYHKKSKDSKSFVDFKSDEKPIWSGNGIDIYEADNVEKCIFYTGGGLTGKRYSFCIGQPANTMYRSYRDTKDSTFYFIVDKNHFKKNADGSVNLDDPLHIVVFDMSKRGIELTDANNTTGNIAQYGKNVNAYVNYLKSKGVPVEKLVNRPKTEQEILEQKLLGKRNENLDWFKKLPIELKSSYIGRGHILTDDQFDYLLTSKELISQYVDTGLKLPQYQVSKLSNNDKKTYIRKRIMAETGQFDEYEIKLLNADQEKELLTYVVQNPDKLSFKGYETELMNSDQKKEYIGNIEKFDKNKFDDFIYRVFISPLIEEERLDREGIGNKHNYIKLSNLLLNEKSILNKIKRYYTDYFISFLFQISKGSDKAKKIIILSLRGEINPWVKLYSNRFK
jgi:hypothetical protein